MADIQVSDKMKNTLTYRRFSAVMTVTWNPGLAPDSVITFGGAMFGGYREEVSKSVLSSQTLGEIMQKLLHYFYRDYDQLAVNARYANTWRKASEDRFVKVKSIGFQGEGENVPEVWTVAYEVAGWIAGENKDPIPAASVCAAMIAEKGIASYATNSFRGSDRYVSVQIKEEERLYGPVYEVDPGDFGFGLPDPQLILVSETANIETPTGVESGDPILPGSTPDRRDALDKILDSLGDLGTNIIIFAVIGLLLVFLYGRAAK